MKTANALIDEFHHSASGFVPARVATQGSLS